jgi:PPE-repeat protein
MPAYGDSAANPPEVNYWTLMTGDHAASAAAAAAGHQALADILATEMAQLTSNATMTATVGWQGVGGTAMTVSAAQLAEIMGLAVAWLQQGSLQAAELVQAYHTAAQGMIPGPVCTTNRTTQAGLVATNFLGVNQPAITSLDISYGEHWTQNAAVMAAYQAVVTAVLAALAIPPPFAPPTSNPAAAALSGAAQAGATAATNSLQSGFQGMSETANAASPATQGAASTATEGMSSMSSMMGMPMQMAGQFGQMFGQVPQMLGQAPQMLSQAVQMPMGMLGQLSSTSGVGGADAAAEEAALQQGAMAPGVAAAGLGGAGGGGGGGLGAGGGVAPATSYTRPVSSFATPSSPKLPAGFTGGVPAAEFTPGGTQGTGGGAGGGLYGAPGAMANRDGAGNAEQRPNRTMQLTARPGIDRGDR